MRRYVPELPVPLDVFPADNGPFAPVHQTVVPPETSDHDRAKAREQLAPLVAPASPEDIETWLAELAVITSRRVDDESTETLRLTAYSSRLAKLPADVARHVLLEKRWKFWPSWAELADAADALWPARRLLVRELAEPCRIPVREAGCYMTPERAAEWHRRESLRGSLSEERRAMHRAAREKILNPEPEED